MTNTQKYAIEVAKEIIVAKFHSSAPNNTNADVGKATGEMFEAIYNKVYEICSKDEGK